MRKYQDSIHEIRVILNPDVLKRLKEEDEELLVELERRYAGRLMFRGDPTFHHEKFLITDANTGVELKPKAPKKSLQSPVAPAQTRGIQTRGEIRY
jgi:hypothetical protein